ncbi:MAG: hypothetical protein IPJ07_05110 [Acidobacteria bacterium]|nr:hypothetical protein [Acidobacteriota bacterium]
MLTEDIADGSLELELTEVPAGLTVSAIFNDEGNIVATISADCDAKIGTVFIGIKVINVDGLCSIASLMVHIKDAAGEQPEIPDLSPGVGSMLVYNLSTSSISNPSSQNTRINMTNTHQHKSVSIHLFWVDGETCQVADSTTCLTPNQTLSLLSSDIDPGITGFLVAVAMDKQTGMPISFNYLMGDEYVKLESGHESNLRAEAIKSSEVINPAIQTGPVEAEIRFDGIHYQQMPRTLCLSNLSSNENNNQTMLIVNRIGGDISASFDKIGEMFGLVYDGQGDSYGFCVNETTCQFISIMGPNFPKTSPRLDDIIPSGRSGWLKIWATNDISILGSVIIQNPDTNSVSDVFKQGHNLHKLTYNSISFLTVPIFPAGC